MALKSTETSRKRKGKEPTTGSFDSRRFHSKLHEELFFEVTSKRAVISKVKFVLKPNEYPKIWFQIERQGWQFICDPHTEIGQLIVQEFYGNTWITYKDVQGVNEKNHQSFVRGNILDFTPRSI
ncbi:hypothetical protein AHAS_Ahas01G0133500 [Arachis hypogaea]